MEKWFVFRAYNSETIYGYGTDAEAAAYCGHLNQNREINVYAVYGDDVEAWAADHGVSHIEDAGFNLCDELTARQ